MFPSLRKLRKYFAISALVILSFLFHPVQAQQSPARYSNPIIPGFNPDPSICRAGEDYYLVTSTFEYFPGVPVYHSRDLVHWKMIGHVLHRPSQLDLDTMRCSGGIYAPTIRYNKGTFYMITTLVGGGNTHKNFIVTAQKPEGPWSEPHWIADAPGIDPSLFFDDDGKVYYSGNVSPAVKLWDKHRNIWVQELDLKTWKLVGKRVDVLDGGEYYENNKLGPVNNYEASHIYKKDGAYYLLIAHGGTSQNHAVSIWKSKNVFGPYEVNPANPILTHRDLSPEHVFTSTGHADVVQTQKGDWWMVYLAKRPYGGENHIMGRETFMTPFDWSGVWPVVNPNGQKGRGEATHPVPNLPVFKQKDFSPKDDFNGPALEKYWTFIRTPRTEWWSLAKRKGFLRLDLRPEMISEQVNPSFVGKRQEDKNFSTAVKLDFTPAAANEEAGLVVERDKDYYFKFTLGMADGKTVVCLTRKAGPGSNDSLISKAPFLGQTIFLKISADGVLYTFSYSSNGKEWNALQKDVDGRILGLAGAGRFTGTLIGMYASSNGVQSKNYADFDWFDYQKMITRDQRMGWWREARFGMFIHWGVYAVPAGTYKGQKINRIGEWIMNRGKIPVADYQAFAKEFNPVKYDPDAWVRMAKDAGMKYIVITSKHHDGFSLFNSKASKWNIVDATPYGKDLLKPLADACRKHGIKLGFYYSHAQDWNNPGGSAARKAASEGWANPDSAKIDEYTAAHEGHWDSAQTTASMSDYIDRVAVPQVKEILTNYGDVAVLWWDTPTGMTDEYAEKLQALLELQPNIITNDRLKRPNYPGDYKTPEQKIPTLAELDGKDWETCMTMNGTWGYKSYDDKWKTPQTLIRNLIDIASKGGNYLLNVGPKADGEFPQQSVELLKAMGGWMKVNGEAIYGTKKSPLPVQSWGRCTMKEQNGKTILYLSVFDWPADGKLNVAGWKNSIQSAALLSDGMKLQTVSGEGAMIIEVPKNAPDAIATVIRVEVDGAVKSDGK